MHVHLLTLAGAIGLVAITASLGCRRNAGSPAASSSHAPAEEAHDHDHEPQSARITVWTDRFEVFAEHPAPAAGQAVTFVTHVTRLSDGKPRSEGPVTFRLRLGATSLEHFQAAPARPGIYLPRLHFPQPGEWQVSLDIPDPEEPATVELGTVRVHPDPHAAEHQEFPSPPDGVTFLKEHQWKLPFRSESLARTSLTQRVRTPARILLPPGRGAHALAPLGGRLESAPGAQALRPGDPVKAGQILALLRPVFSETTARLAETEAEFATAQATLAQAESALARVRRLAAEQAKSAREVQEAELALATARARHAAAAALLGSLRPDGVSADLDPARRIALTAPIDGVLDSITAGPGETVAAGQAVFRVVDPTVVWIEARIPEARIDGMRAAADALLESRDTPGRFARDPADGWLRPVAFGLEVDPDTRTVPLVYEVSNPDHRLRPGQWVNLAVAVAHATNALVLPDTGIVEEAGRPIGYVQLDGETFEKRELTLGIRDGDRVEVLFGIAAGERVVTLGAYAVRLASLSASLPSHGHAH